MYSKYCIVTFLILSMMGVRIYAQQVPVPASGRDAAMRAEIASGLQETGDKGFAALINRPGLGFDVNEKALDAYSEERA